MFDLLINAGGIVLIALIALWFWWWPQQRVAATGSEIAIEVANGVYSPDYIEVKRGSVVTLNFHRTDPSLCAEQVIFHDLDISATLPVGSTTPVRIAPTTVGSYRFTCQMQMYQGTLVVVD